ncbi:MAG: cytochrome c biogenesis protein CcdA [Patescibacteria group bacterium]
MITELSFVVAFSAGVVSFLSPCVLPIVPGFLAYLAGGTAVGEQPSRFKIFLNSAFFVLGFSLVFAVLGVLLNTLLERVAYDAQVWLARIGGAIIIFFGLYLTGLIRVRFLERAHKFSVKTKFSSRELTSFIFGAAFAAGWTPCVGAALGAILGLAASEPGTAFSLLMAYALGLGMPFLVVGLFAGEAGVAMTRFANVAGYITRGFGVILIGLGILIFTQKLALLASFGLVERLLGV